MSVEKLSPNSIVIMDLAESLADKKPEVAKGILIGGLLGMNLTSIDRNAMGAALAALQLQVDKTNKEVGIEVMQLIAFSQDEQVTIAHYLKQAHIIDDKGNLI